MVQQKGARGRKIVFILKAKWKEKLSTVNNGRGGGGGMREEGVGGSESRAGAAA